MPWVILRTLKGAFPLSEIPTSHSFEFRSTIVADPDLQTLLENPYIGVITTKTDYPTPVVGLYFDAAKIKYQRLREDAIPPSVSQKGDAAADLFAIEDITIPARSHALVKTGIAIELPRGFEWRFKSRSGLSLKQGIEKGAGLIDTSYRNEVGVVLYNHTDEDYHVKRGQAVVNASLHRYTYPVFEEVEELSSTERSAGWGSSGR